MPNERLIIHGEGFNFLTFASSLHADWTIGGRKPEIVSFFFKSSRHHAANPCGRSYQRLVTSVSAYRKINSNRPPPVAAVFLENGRSEPIQIVSFLDSFDRRRAQTWKSAVLKPSDSSTTAAHTLFSS